MTPAERQYASRESLTPAERQWASLILLWSRTLDEHKLDFDSWVARRARR